MAENNEAILPHHQGIMPFFVYGTLMRSDGAADRWIDLVDRVEAHMIVEGYTLYVTTGSFPYAIKSDVPGQYIFGEMLWPKSDKAAGWLTERFDRIESHPAFYVRTEVKVLRNSKSVQPAWMYVLPHEHMWSPNDYKEIGASWKTWKADHPEWRGSALV